MITTSVILFFLQVLSIVMGVFAFHYTLTQKVELATVRFGLKLWAATQFIVLLFGGLFLVDQLGGVWWSIWSFAALAAVLVTVFQSEDQGDFLFGAVVTMVLMTAAASRAPIDESIKFIGVIAQTLVAIAVMFYGKNPLKSKSSSALLIFLAWLLAVCSNSLPIAGELLLSFLIPGVLLILVSYEEQHSLSLGSRHEDFGDAYINQFIGSILAAHLVLVAALMGFMSVPAAFFVGLLLITYNSLRNKLVNVAWFGFALQIIVLVLQKNQLNSLEMLGLAVVLITQIFALLFSENEGQQKPTLDTYIVLAISLELAVLGGDFTQILVMTLLLLTATMLLGLEAGVSVEVFKKPAQVPVSYGFLALILSLIAAMAAATQFGSFAEMPNAVLWCALLPVASSLIAAAIGPLKTESGNVKMAKLMVHIVMAFAVMTSAPTLLFLIIT